MCIQINYLQLYHPSLSLHNLVSSLKTRTNHILWLTPPTPAIESAVVLSRVVKEYTTAEMALN